MPRRFPGYTRHTPQLTETTPSKHAPACSRPRDLAGSTRSPECSWKANGPAGALLPKRPRQPPATAPRRRHKPPPNRSRPWHRYWPQLAESAHLAAPQRRTKTPALSTKLAQRVSWNRIFFRASVLRPPPFDPLQDFLGFRRQVRRQRRLEMQLGRFKKLEPL